MTLVQAYPRRIPGVSPRSVWSAFFLVVMWNNTPPIIYCIHYVVYRRSITTNDDRCGTKYLPQEVEEVSLVYYCFDFFLVLGLLVLQVTE